MPCRPQDRDFACKYTEFDISKSARFDYPSSPSINLMINMEQIDLDFIVFIAKREVRILVCDVFENGRLRKSMVTGSTILDEENRDIYQLYTIGENTVVERIAATPPLGVDPMQINYIRL